MQKALVIAGQLPSHFVLFVRREAVRSFNFTLSESLLAFHTTNLVDGLIGRYISTEITQRGFLLSFHLECQKIWVLT